MTNCILHSTKFQKNYRNNSLKQGIKMHIDMDDNA